MTLPGLIPISKALSLPTNENSLGETPLAFAPSVKLDNGTVAVPQQFLEVNRTLENLETVLAKISLPHPFQLFAGQEQGVLFLVVAIVGQENYPQKQGSQAADKIVYGRRWLIEESTPTSEVIQTALLACKKVREHELREKIQLRTEAGKATPFNNHLDLPLLAGTSNSLKRSSNTPSSAKSFRSQLNQLTVDDMRCELISKHTIAKQYVIEIALTGKAHHFDDLSKGSIMVVCEDETDFLHAFAQALINRSDRTIDETFTYDNFARFSSRVSAQSLADFSIRTRNIQANDERFDSAFKDMSYRVDASKAPFINGGKLGQQQREFLSQFENLAGYAPLDP